MVFRRPESCCFVTFDAWCLTFFLPSFLFLLPPNQNLSTWVRIHQLIAPQDQLVMICSIGKPLSWDPMILHMLEVFSSWTFTFLPIIHSSHPRFTSPLVFTTATLTRMEVSAWISWRINGVLLWPSAKSYYQSVPFSLTPTQMIHWFQTLLNSWSRTGQDTIAPHGNGRPNTRCNVRYKVALFPNMKLVATRMTCVVATIKSRVKRS